MNRRWFNQLLLSYLPVFFLISISLLLITVLTVNELSKKNARTSTAVLSQNTLEFINFTLMNIELAIESEILGNELIKDYYRDMGQQELDFHITKVVAVLDAFQNKLSFVDAVYLYRPANRSILMPTRYTTLENFGDSAFAREAAASKGPFRWTGIRPYGEFLENAEGGATVSLVRFVDYRTKGIVVINVNLQAVRQVIRQMAGSSLQYIELIDQHGRVIAANDAEEQAEQPRQSSIYSETVSSYTGWTIRSGMNRSTFSVISSYLYYWLGLGIAVILLCFVLLLNVSRRNFKPIESIVGHIMDYSKQHADLPPPAHKDVFQVIQSTIDSLMDHSRQLRENATMTEAIRKQQLFAKLLENGGQAERGSLDEQLTRLGMKSGTEQPTSVALLEIDQYAAFCAAFADKDRHLFKNSAYQLIAELLEKRRIKAWAEWVDNHRLAIVLFAAPAADDDADRMPERICRACLESIGGQLNFTVTIALKHAPAGWSSLTDAYHGAINLLEFKASLGQNRLIAEGDVAKPPEPQSAQLQYIISAIHHYRTSEPQWLDDLTQLHLLFKRMLIAKAEFMSYMYFFVFHLEHELSKLGDLRKESQQHVPGQLKQILQYYDTIDDVFDRFRQVLGKEHEQFLEVRHGKQNYQLIHKIRLYVNDHFHDPDLSLTHLNERFHMSSSNISRLFKTYFNTNLIEYITQTRIDHSKKLLRETDLPVQTVALQVGYINSLTYIKTFKKMTGMTPGTFRKTQQPLDAPRKSRPQP